MKLDFLCLLFLLSTVIATETVQINNQTFKLVPIGRMGSKLGSRSESGNFKLVSIPMEREGTSEGSDNDVTDAEGSVHSEDTFDCELRIPVLGTGLVDLEHLVNQYNSQKMTCKVSYVNGDKYEGEVQQKLRDGSGQMVYATGEIYNGQWSSDAENGTGTCVAF